MVGKLERVALRDVFPHEARSLSKWLADNADVLSEAVGRQILITQREAPVGAFSIDLFGEDDEGSFVVVENQLERSDHDHLGKLLTYVAGRDAKIAIWIVSDPRPEHVTAVNWLNETGLCAFYLFKVEAVKIGQSDTAPLLTRITSPSEELLASGVEKKEQVQREIDRTDFWNELLPISNTKIDLFSNVSPSRYNYLWGSAGRSGTGYVYRVTQDEIGVEFYLGGPDKEKNATNFRTLLDHKAEIEARFGGVLEWDDMGDAKACRIKKTLTVGGYRSKRELWPLIIEEATDSMQRLYRATQPEFGNLR